eukprot:1137613-Pelagomonas_calceolata.AAC.13
MHSPHLQLGPLRNVPGAAEVVGCMSAAGLVLILALCLSLYGNAAFQSTPSMGKKTLSGRPLAQDPLMSSEGWPMMLCAALEYHRTWPTGHGKNWALGKAVEHGV